MLGESSRNGAGKGWVHLCYPRSMGHMWEQDRLATEPPEPPSWSCKGLCLG